MLSGIKYFLTGLRLVFKPGLKRFVIIPVLINMAIFAIGLWLGMSWFDRFLQSILPTWMAWAEYLLWPLFAIGYFLVVFYLFALIANILAAPFNGLLAEKAEHYLRGTHLQQKDSSLKKVIIEIPQTIGSEISKLIYFLLRALPLLVLFLIPGINILAPLFWFLFSAWMLGLEYLDYPLGNHHVLFRQTRVIVRSHRSRCLSFGSLVSAMTMIPIVNFIVMPVAVVGATALFVDAIDLEKHDHLTR